MADIPFVPQTGTKEDNKDTRKAIRRHVMLGKNQGKTRDPKGPTLPGYGMFGKNNSKRKISPIESEIPRRVGSDLSFVKFADTVEPYLMNDTLHFCAATNEKLFVLEPCIIFGSTDMQFACVQSLTLDALHVNAMVLGTQAYIGGIFQQSTSEVRKGSSQAILRHHGQALRLLRQRLSDMAVQRSEVFDITVTSIMTLTSYALFIGDIKAARNHVIGLKDLVSMTQMGIHSFEHSTKQMIEILRCDISVSLATGKMPLFFQDPLHEPVFLLPDLEPLDRNQERCPVLVSGKLTRIWETLVRFCAMINKAVVDGRRISDRILLETMASVMYRLLEISVAPGSIDEAIHVAMLSFCASTLLPLRQIRMPLTWLQLRHKLSLANIMKSQPYLLPPPMALWCLMIYAVAFFPLPADEGDEFDSWLVKTMNICGSTTWHGVKEVAEDFLWIEMVYDRSAQRIVEETLREKGIRQTFQKI